MVENNGNEDIYSAMQMQAEPKGVKKATVVAVGIVALLGGWILGGNSDRFFTGPIGRSSESLDLSSVQELFSEINNKYVGEIDRDALVEGAKRGLVSALDDPFSSFMNAEEQAEMTSDLNGQFSGIGAELAVRNDLVTIVRLIQGSPAQRSGLQAGDIIYTVNGEDMTSSSAATTASAIRGEAGTQVEVVIMRDGSLRTFNITRERITNPSVYNEIREIDGKRIMILNVNSFASNSGDMAYSQVREALNDGGLDGVILDLRGNGGGYVNAAQGLAGLWLDGQTVMSERNINSSTNISSIRRRNILADIPTVVLINGSSASASEIVAGALRDHGKATLVGEKSFGKGSMQEMIGLRGGSWLKLTVASWYTPNGLGINGQGLEPDEVVGLTVEDLNAGQDPQIDEAIKRLTK